MLIMATDGKKNSGDVDDIRGSKTEIGEVNGFPVFVMKAATLNDACLVIQMFKTADSQG